MSMPSMPGTPTLMSEPSRSSSTRPSLIDEPGSSARRSTRIWSPGATLYCFPPLITTAVNELSDLGTNGILPRPADLVSLPHQERRDHDQQEDEHRVRCDRLAVEAPGGFGSASCHQRARADAERCHRQRDAEEPQNSQKVIRRWWKEKRGEKPAIGEPAARSELVEA